MYATKTHTPLHNTSEDLKWNLSSLFVSSWLSSDHGWDIMLVYTSVGNPRALWLWLRHNVSIYLCMQSSSSLVMAETQCYCIPLYPILQLSDYGWDTMLAYTSVCNPLALWLWLRHNVSIYLCMWSSSSLIISETHGYYCLCMWSSS